MSLYTPLFFTLFYIFGSNAFMTCEDKSNNVVISKSAMPKLRKMWQPKEVKYAVLNYPAEMSLEETEEAIADAFNQWSRVIPIEFRNVARTGELANIKIYFNFSICHVYAFSVVTDKTVFNNKFKWAYKDSARIMSGEYIDLNKIALHEIGHHLGIPDDFGRWGSVMHTDFKPYYDKTGQYIRPSLGPDDILNVQKLYGARNSVSGVAGPFAKARRF